MQMPAVRNMDSAAAARVASGRGRALTCLFLALIWGLAVWFLYRGAVPPDLSAVYVAGHLFADGQPDLVYAARVAGPVGVPVGWEDAVTELGLGGRPVYAYVYPPLWAALAAPVSSFVPPGWFFATAYQLMAGCVALTLYIVLRAIRPPGGVVPWFGLGLAGTLATIGGQLAFYNCQPQIAVGLLVVLAIERQMRRLPLAAGAALALAASIKLYPALFLLWFVAARDRRAILAFLLAGAALAALSLALGGWTLHLAFLDRVAAIGAQIHGIAYNYNLENLIYQLAHAGRLPVEAGTGTVGQFALPDPYWMPWIVHGALAAGLVLIAARWQAGPPDWRFGTLFPAALILVSLALPLGWAHQFLPVLTFLPGLMRVYGRLAGLACMLAVVVLQSYPLTVALAATPAPVMLPMLAGAGTFLALFFLFALAPAGSGRPSPPRGG